MNRAGESPRNTRNHERHETFLRFRDFRVFVVFVAQRLSRFALIFTTACGGSATTAPSNSPSQPVPTAQPLRVLMLTATAGFRHDSIQTAKQVMAALASRSGAFSVAATE